jgi:hypothetical protein
MFKELCPPEPQERTLLDNLAKSPDPFVHGADFIAFKHALNCFLH